jgi:hypothetical protein
MAALLIEKHPDWIARLHRYVASVYRTPFEPGIHDCALFAATCVMIQDKAGTDFAAEFRGRYNTLEDGLSLLQAAGYADHVALAADKLAEIAPADARIGDIAVVELGDAAALTVVGGTHLTGPMMGMRGSVSRLLAVRAFAVGWQP